MISKAVKAAKPVSKTAGKTGRPAVGAAAKKTAAKTVKAKVSVTPSAKNRVKAAPVKKAAVKSSPVRAAAPKSQAQARKAPVAKSKAVPSASRSAAASVAAKSQAARSHGKTAADSRARSPAHHPVQMLTRSTVAIRPIAIKKDPRLANNWKIKPIEQWTDAEVICMPDEEYMNDKQLAFFRWKLLQLKNDILTSAGETTEHLRSDTVVVPDPADRATIEEEHALELRTRDRERKLLRKIEQSIARIDAGDYGYCDETGEPIGVPRLLARPTATLSLEAQQRRELKQKLFGD